MQDRFHAFTVRISQISRLIRRIKTEEMKSFGLKGVHVSCLYYLYKQGNGMAAKDLCEVCEEDKSAVSRSLEYLERNGYITCDERVKKRYNSLLRLTDKGVETGKVITEKIDGILRAASEGLGEEDRACLYRSLALVADNLQKICNQYGE